MTVEAGGSYSVSDPIAKGGMASLHLGLPLKSGEPIVALKKIHDHLRHHEGVTEMLLEEAKIAARIRHKNVVTTLGTREIEGATYIVMDYIQGSTVDTLLRRLERKTKVPVKLAVAIISGALRGLHAAHELGIIHRDVSPQNILVGCDGIPRVIDFGIAKAAERQGRLTQHGELKGKLAYLSPEQLNEKDLDGRTDVHGASIVLWELLTRRRLFRGKHDAATLAKIAQGKRPSPSKFNTLVTPELAAIVMKGLAFDREDRFVSARAMADALDRLVPSTDELQRELGEWVASHGDELAIALDDEDVEEVSIIPFGAVAPSPVPHFTAPAAPRFVAAPNELPSVSILVEFASSPPPAAAPAVERPVEPSPRDVITAPAARPVTVTVNNDLPEKPASSWKRFERWVGRYPVEALMLSAVTVAMIIGLSATRQTPKVHSSSFPPPPRVIVMPSAPAPTVVVQAPQPQPQPSMSASAHAPQPQPLQPPQAHASRMRSAARR